MELNFAIQQTTSKELHILDTTKQFQAGSPDVINYFTLDIKSGSIPNGLIDNPIDIVAYLYTKRVDNEIYVIKSEDLGLASNIDIPEGLYTLTTTINNTYQKIHNIVVWFNTKKKYDQLATEVSSAFEITPNGIKYINEEKVKQFGIATSLVLTIEKEALEGDTSEIDTLLKKLQRVLLNVKLNN